MKTLIKNVLAKRGWNLERIDHRPQVFRDTKRIMPNPNMILDIGANVGQSVGHYRSVYPASVPIHCFEPSPTAAAAIGGENVLVYLMAMTDDNTTATFNIARESQICSLMPFSEGGKRQFRKGSDIVEQITVEAMRLDSWLKIQGIDRVDVLKIDTEGAEGKVLAGAYQLLSEHRAGVVMIESNFSPLWEGQAFFSDVFEVMRAHGYRLFGLYDLHWGGDQYLDVCNSLFVAPEVPIKERLIASAGQEIRP